ncbi:MAG: hypothetical protein ABEI97_01300 [Candidatus Nanohaloarchaea archaeon]
MDTDTLTDFFWLAAGGHVVAIGGALAVLDAFQGRFLSTYAGIVLFIFGYKLSWYGLHRDHPEQLKTQIERMSDTGATPVVQEVVMFTIGGFGIAAGIYLFAMAVRGTLPLIGYLAGAVSFGGYIIAHKQLNKAVI